MFTLVFMHFLKPSQHIVDPVYKKLHWYNFHFQMAISFSPFIIKLYFSHFLSQNIFVLNVHCFNYPLSLYLQSYSFASHYVTDAFRQTRGN